MTPDDLLAQQEIRDVLARYCRAVDRLDADLLAAVYHPDATDEHGTSDPDVSAARFRPTVLKYLGEEFACTQHVLGSICIEVTGNIAHSEAYVTAYHVRPPDPDGRSRLSVIGARYVDRFERRAGEWRIATRVAVRDWQETRVAEPLPPGAPAGRRDRSDPVYARA